MARAQRTHSKTVFFVLKEVFKPRATKSKVLVNQVDWSFNNDLWFNILVIGSANKKMITGKESIRSAGMVIAYMVMGNQMTRSEVDDVRQIIRNARNDDNAPLPQMIL